LHYVFNKTNISTSNKNKAAIMVKLPLAVRVKRFIRNWQAEILGVAALLLILSSESIANLIVN